MARNSQDSQEQQDFDVRAELLRTLMSHVEESTYPSVTQLDMIEDLLRTPQDRAAYLQLLIEYVDDARFPSVPMLQRIKKFT